jgi:hypothetical protein
MEEGTLYFNHESNCWKLRSLEFNTQLELLPSNEEESNLEIGR